MRKTKLYKVFLIAVAFGITLYSCVNENEESLIVDCSLSDLAIQLGDVTEANLESGGSITVVGSGGTGEYLYSIDGITFGSNAVFDNLVAGSYTITIMDVSLGCTATVEATVDAIGEVIAFDLITNISDCGNNTGSITVNVTNGAEPIEYSIDGTNFVTSNVFDALAPGNYTITARNVMSQVTSETTILTDVTLSGNIMPIINTYCALPGCHADAVSPNMNNSTQIIAAAPRIMVRAVNRTMPPSGFQGPTDAEIDEIVCWVNDGTLDN